jgi:autotransporter-associated beta strand protein
MRTPHSLRERKHTIPQAEINNHGFLRTALGSLLLVVAMAAPALAVDSAWLTNPGSSDWNADANWSPPMAPEQAGDTATFNTSNITSLFLSGDVTINSMTFNQGADAFTIDTSGHSFSFVGAGIVNNSAQTQTIMVGSGGIINFYNTSNAGNATITISGDGTESGSGFVFFHDGSSAGNATIDNNAPTVLAPTPPDVIPTLAFLDSATAGTAVITNSGPGSSMGFFDTSTAENATITNSGPGSLTDFNQSATAESSVITNSGQDSTLQFLNSSTAANATITNSGANSATFFRDSASGGNARLINANATAFFDISGLTTGGTTAGSIEGNGSFFLGSKNLTVGSNGLSTTFSGVIQDGGFSGGTGGSLTKVGTGTLTLTGANTYTGLTTVNGGSLIVDGSIASAQTFVNAGGLLGGTGVIGGNLTNGGIVSPGHAPGSLGTLTVNGNYTQTPNGTLRIEVAGTAPGQFDLLAVGGHASLAGTLQLISLGNFQLQVGDKITFLTAQGGVSGTFSTIQNPFVSNTLIKAEITILGNAVQLEGTQGSFTEVACNPNTVAVGGALNSAVGDPRASELIAFLDTQPLSDICPELELISPEEVAGIFNIGVSLANIQTVNLQRRMEDIRAGSSGFSATGLTINTRERDFNMGLAGPTGPEGKSGPSVMQPTPQNRWGVFVTGLGEFTSVDDTSIAPGYNFSTGGLTFGVDYRVSPNFAIGLTGGYAHTNADLVNNGSLDVNGGTIGAYATGFGGGFYVDAAAFGVFNGYDSHRTALLGTASGNTDGQDFNALVAAGYDWKSGGLTIGPTVSYQYTYVEFDSFTEHGSLAPLSFSNQNANSSRTALGAKASYDWHVGHVVVKPELRAAWQHEFGDRDYSIVSRFANGAGNSFTVNGPEIGRDSLLIGAGAAVMFNDRVSVYAYYDGELARTNYSSNNVSAGLRFTF